MSLYLSTLLRTAQALIHKMRHSSLGISFIPIVLLVLVGTAAYSYLEGWSLLDALYATIITITTVGYGDLSPQTGAGRIFAILFTLLAIGFASYAISTLAAVVIEHELVRGQRNLQERRMKRIHELNNHVIICGGGIMAHRVANELRKRKTPFVLIESDEQTLKWALLWLHEEYVSKRQQIWGELAEVDIESEEEKSVDQLAAEVGILYLQEDPTQELVLRRAGIERAQGLVAALNDDRDNLGVVLSARDMATRLENENFRIVTRVVDEWNMRRLSLAGADSVISPNIQGGFLAAARMLDPVMTDFWDHMLYRDSNVVRFTDIRVADKPSLASMTVAQLKQEDEQLVIAIHRGGEYLYAPDGDMAFQPDDTLILMGPTLTGDSSEPQL